MRKISMATGKGSEFQYSGQRRLNADLYLRNRSSHYNPSTGRFLQEDPIGFGGQDINLYGYVRNNPVSFIDPLGFLAEDPLADADPSDIFDQPGERIAQLCLMYPITCQNMFSDIENSPEGLELQRKEKLEREFNELQEKIRDPNKSDDERERLNPQHR